MSQLGNLPARLHDGLEQQFMRWTQFLLDEHSQGVVVHLKALYDMLKNYFPRMASVEMTLRSKIEMIEKSAR